jgi:hypothetical protein
MAKRAAPTFLKLVHSEQLTSPANGNVAPEGVTQDSFLPSGQTSTLIFLAWGKTTHDDILDVFELSRPKMILDMRVAPRFDLGQLNRKQFFSLLKDHDCRYVDLLGRIGVSSLNDALANPKLIAAHAGQFTGELKPAHSGPLVFLHDEETVDDEYLTLLARALPSGVGPWQVYKPTFATPNSRARPKDADSSSSVLPLNRSVVFISHATPEDNDFTLWLAGKLGAAGYEVWSDLTHLQGGDGFWGNIEEVIRARAAKVLFVHSAKVTGKPGTRKEVFLGLKIGERNKLPRFVVPLRIDATRFDDTFIELIDVQSIDFRADWLMGLQSVLSLLNRDGVPRSQSFRADQFGEMVTGYKRSPISLMRAPETLVSNILPITGAPPVVNFFNVEGIQTNKLREVVKDLAVPAFDHFALIGTWASAERLQAAFDELDRGATKVTVRKIVPLAEFLQGVHGDLPQWKRSDARNKTFAMLHAAWWKYVKSRGGIAGLLANDRYFTFFQDRHLPDNKIHFLDFSGRMVRRQLVGFSKKRRVFWHFGVQARSVLEGDQLSYSLTPHVTFSADGKAPLDSKSQLHSLRRSFCRSWWNDRWRDLMQGFVCAIADGDQMRIDIGGAEPMTVASRFLDFRSPVSPSAEGVATSTELSEEVADQWDEDEFEEFDDAEQSAETSEPEQ